MGPVEDSEAGVQEAHFWGWLGRVWIPNAQYALVDGVASGKSL